MSSEHAHAEVHAQALDGAHAHAHLRPAPRRVDGKFTAGEARQARRLTIVLALVAVFFVLELAGALAARSVVLQADALHLLTDVLALAMSLLAMRLAVRRPTPRFTFGLRRAEPVAAIFNAILVLGATFQIVREAIGALEGHGAPEPGLMLLVATAALVVNGVSAWLLHDAIGHAGHAHDPDNPDELAHAHAHHHDHAHHKPDSGVKKAHGHALNLRGAWLHLLGDTLGALAALVAALVIRFGGPVAADPIASFLVATILVLGAVRLVRDATLVLLEAAPPHLPVRAIRAVSVGFPGVREVHDLHVWMLGAGHDAITVHVRTDSPDPAFGSKLSARLRSQFDVEYVTVQVEASSESCGAPPSLYTDGDDGGSASA
jgi:cation diffusion facilitator family transporter